MKDERKTNGSIWDGIPDDWIENEVKETEEQEKTPEMGSVIIREEVNKKQNHDADDGLDPQIAITKKAEAVKKSDKRRINREQRKREKKYEKITRANRQNSSDKASEAYEIEHHGNKKDFVIMGIVLGVAVVAIIICSIVLMRAPEQKIYNMIDSGSYGAAYQQICDRYERGKNVDDIIYLYVETCINNSEYKRAVAALNMLSDDAGKNTKFFDETVNGFIQHGKSNRVEDVLNILNSRNNDFQKIADNLCKKYEGQY